MKYRLLGRSGLRVSELCLGGMTFGEHWKDTGMATEREECLRILERFARAGGNFVDTANYYNAGRSEELIGEFVASERERFVLATKYTLTMRAADPNAGGNHRKNLMQSLHASLRRLKTDYIDLYWLHVWDGTTPVEEIMRALDDAVRAGKVLYVGISDTPAWVIAKANAIASLRGWSPFVGLQVQYSLVERAAERELLPMARDLELGVTAWSPLGMGLLTGKYSSTSSGSSSETGRLLTPAMSGHPLRAERPQMIARRAQELALKFGHKPAQVALRWILHKGLIPIIGSRRATQIDENLGCLDLDISGELLTSLDEMSNIDLGFPHDLIGAARGIIFGDSLERLQFSGRHAF